MTSKQQYITEAEAAAQRYGLPPKVFVAQGMQESGFNPKATSKSGAQGLYQLMPSTAKAYGVTNAYDPIQNIDAAARMMAELTKSYGSINLALAAYNGGKGAVDYFHKHGGIFYNPSMSADSWANQTGGYVHKILSAAGVDSGVKVEAGKSSANFHQAAQPHPSNKPPNHS